MSNNHAILLAAEAVRKAHDKSEALRAATEAASEQARDLNAQWRTAWEAYNEAEKRLAELARQAT